MAQWLSKGKDHSAEKDNQNEDSEKKRVKKEWNYDTMSKELVNDQNDNFLRKPKLNTEIINTIES